MLHDKSNDGGQENVYCEEIEPLSQLEQPQSQLDACDGFTFTSPPPPLPLPPFISISISVSSCGADSPTFSFFSPPPDGLLPPPPPKP